MLYFILYLLAIIFIILFIYGQGTTTTRRRDNRIASRSLQNSVVRVSDEKCQRKGAGAAYAAASANSSSSGNVCLSACCCAFQRVVVSSDRRKKSRRNFAATLSRSPGAPASGARGFASPDKYYNIFYLSDPLALLYQSAPAPTSR